MSAKRTDEGLSDLNPLMLETSANLIRAHLISRAAETQRFVIGANNAAQDQTCPTMIVSASGEPLAVLPLGDESAAIASVDMSLVSDWVVSQARDDVVSVVLRARVRG